MFRAAVVSRDDGCRGRSLSVSVLTRFVELARSKRGRLVFPEGHDERMLRAARWLADEEIARPIVLGRPDQLQQIAAQGEFRLDGIDLVDPAASPRSGEYAAVYARHRNVEEKIGLRLVKKPLVFGGMMVAQGDADTMVAGVANATATVIQAAALTVGLRSRYSDGVKFLSDGAARVRGTQERAAAVCRLRCQYPANGGATGRYCRGDLSERQKLLADPPRLAMLSSSTLGSAAHADVEKVQNALQIVRRSHPDAWIDGEFQADTALVARVAAKKVTRESHVAGAANVLVFPDLDAGNIAYKLTQYLAGAHAIGPVLQGFAKPISDLSRGASVEDIVATSAICLAQIC